MKSLPAPQLNQVVGISGFEENKILLQCGLCLRGRSITFKSNPCGLLSQYLWVPLLYVQFGGEFLDWKD